MLRSESNKGESGVVRRTLSIGIRFNPMAYADLRHLDDLDMLLAIVQKALSGQVKSTEREFVTSFPLPGSIHEASLQTGNHNGIEAFVSCRDVVIHMVPDDAAKFAVADKLRKSLGPGFLAGDTLTRSFVSPKWCSTVSSSAFSSSLSVDATSRSAAQDVWSGSSNQKYKVGRIVLRTRPQSNKP